MRELKILIKVCPVCGKKFEARLKNKSVCGQKCYGILNKEKLTAKRKEYSNRPEIKERIKEMQKKYRQEHPGKKYKDLTPEQKEKARIRWRAANTLEKERLRSAINYHNQREWKKNVLLQKFSDDGKKLKCQLCGLQDERMFIFDLHHINPKEKDFNFNTKVKSKQRIKKEIEKCTLYCAICHRITHNEKETQSVIKDMHDFIDIAILKVNS
jgi:hypothetical protein